MCRKQGTSTAEWVVMGWFIRLAVIYGLIPTSKLAASACVGWMDDTLLPV